ncbi:MAG: hypothetical protein IT196_24870 [Acidimicrobiales bacterium]|nr:hypothetical protein [Acidimicrobiales bacterium]
MPIVLVAFLLGGLLGVAVWAVAHRHRRHLPLRPSIGRPTAIVMLSVVLVGNAAAVTPRLADVPACPPPADATSLQMDTVNAVTEDRVHTAERVATAAPTGIGLLLARVLGADVCFLRNEQIYVATIDGGHRGSRGFILGGTFLSRPRPEDNSFVVLALYHHEARHRQQWAWGTVLGGPLAYPVVYTLDDVCFPGAQNHFEQLADVRTGHYSLPDQVHPRFGLRTVLGALAVAGLLEGAAALHRRRQRARLPLVP